MTYCYSVSASALGENCVRDIECSLPDDLKQERVWCYSGQCSCKKGFIRDGDRCVIGGDCTSDQDCKDLENSLCNIMLRDRAKCTCRDSFVAAANTTLCLPLVHEIGTGCDYSEQCSPNLGKVEYS
ncbi:hypothetical protein L798_13519 [Zootermopsis nevadensis]|uniref:EB domain-containing protein n=1 Tax=Zootermopsis nevadensis TaxID=136037 RepID=A0A067QRQ3_ZOONE|nr:hypothetical protein L798_13519 [Zootermopsis nevadensis]